MKISLEENLLFNDSEGMGNLKGMVRYFIILTALGGLVSEARADLLEYTRTKAQATKTKPTPAPSRPSSTRSVAKPASSDSTFSSWYLSGGTHTEFFNKVQVDDSGHTRRFDWKAPVIGIGGTMNISPAWNFIPEFNWVLPRTANTDRIIVNLFMLRGDFAYDARDWLRLRIGTSIMWQNIHGRGGSVEERNGASGTSKFYYPDENRSSLNNTLDFGAEWLINTDWAFRLQSYTYALFNEEKRQLSYTLFLSYYWK